MFIAHLHQRLQTVHNWVNKRDCTSTCDALRSGHPIEAAMPEIIDKVHR